MKQIINRERLVNKSMSFLLPCLLDSIEIDKKSIVNCYLFHDDDYHPPKIIVKMKWRKGMGAYEKEVMNSEHFLEHLDSNDKEHVIYKFKIPDEYLNDYYKLLEGKYSLLSTKLKRNIRKCWKVNSNSKLYKVLEKSDELRQQMEEELVCTIPASAELSSKPNFKEETYND